MNKYTVLLIVLLNSLFISQKSFAQNWPSKPVKVVVTLSAGSTSDILARIICEQLTRNLGQSFIVENRPGAGGNIAGEYVMHQPADGYTVMLSSISSHGINPALYAKIRPGARYYHSLRLLEIAKETNPLCFTKSGIMVGLGENKEEIIQVMDDLRFAEVDFITIGQYLQPSAKHHPLNRYYHPDEFKELETVAITKGFLLVSSSPLTRSSYHADEDFRKLQDSRNKKLECHQHQ